MASTMARWARALRSSVRNLLDLDTVTGMPRGQRLVARHLRATLMVVRLDVYNNIKLHAQALTYDTLLALVPLLVVIFAIFKGFGVTAGLGERLTALVTSNFSGAPEVQEALATYISQFMGTVQSGHIGAVSVLLLAISVISLLGHIESALNCIFGATSVRPVVLRLLTYWAVLTFGPLLLAASFGLTATLQNSRVSAYIDGLSVLGALLLFATPLLVTWLAFTTMYFFVPNTRVRIGSALVAAMVAGSLWNGWKLGYAWYAKRSITLQNIYGSLAVIPLFVLWLYISWLIVLFGAQLAFALQNAETYRGDEDSASANQSFTERAACRLLLEVARDFYAGRPATTLEELTLRLRLPPRLVESLVLRLRLGGFLLATEPDGILVPGRDLQKVTVESVVAHLRTGAQPEPAMIEDEARRFVDELFARLDELRAGVAGVVDFRELAARFGPVQPADPAARAMAELCVPERDPKAAEAAETADAG